jgi:amino acid transporter
VNEIFTCRNLNYWDSVSTLAGEVANPHKTFPLALMLAVILVILMYVLPLLACLGVMTDTSDWKLGFFATVARQVGGQWLAWWMLAAAAVSHQDCQHDSPRVHQDCGGLPASHMQRCSL